MRDIIPADFAYQAPEPPRHHENPLGILHRHLRGRYKWAALLGLLLAVPLGVVGYIAVPPIYTSTGIVRIAPTLQLKVFDLKEAKVPEMFESLVATQATQIRGRRVLDKALEDPALKPDNTPGKEHPGWPAGDEGLALLIKNLDVSNRAAPELITVMVKNKHPYLAQAAVNSILAAYKEVYEDGGSANYTARERDIRDHQVELQSQIQLEKSRIKDIAKDYATDDLSGIHQGKIDEMFRLDREIAAMNLAIASREGSGDAVTPGAPDAVSEDTVAALALQDPVLARLVEDQRGISNAVDTMLLSKGEGHREVVAAKQRLEIAKKAIEDRANELRAEPRSQSDVTNTAAMSVDELKERRDRFVRLREENRDAAAKLQTAKSAITSSRELISDKKRELDEITQTLEKIHFEGAALEMGRMGIYQRGERPVAPFTDRRIPLAVMGVVGGFILGTGIILLAGIAKGGLRYIDDIEHAEGGIIPLLGTVPDLTDGGAEQEQMAALSVHHLRNMLQLGSGTQPGGKVYTVTSSSAGDGKTSIAIALAHSFAASGRRTIIVDTDLVGRGLTRQLELSGKPGLCEAMNSDTLNGEVHQTKIANLWSIPCGLTRDFVPEHLSAHAISHIIAQLRRQFDTVILDTGPILGSLEANVVAPASDGVVLVVSRGQNSKAVHASIQRLRRLGANCSGLIFNRAGARDFERSVSTASVSARSTQAAAASPAQPRNPGRANLLRALEAPPHIDSETPAA